MPTKIDTSGVLRSANRFSTIAKNLPQAKQRAIGTLVRRIQVEARRDIQEEYNLPAGRINQGLSVSKSTDSVSLRASGKGIPKINFAGRQPKKGIVSYQVFKQGARATLPEAFIAKGLSGNAQILQRISKPRLPIATQYGPSVAQMLRKQGRPERLGDFAQAILSKEIDRILKF